MARPPTCTPGAALTDVALTLIGEEGNAVAVVAATSDKPLGLITGTNFIRNVVLGRGANAYSAADVMEPPSVTVTPDTDIRDALALVDRHQVPYLLVVDGSTGAYGGVVSRAAIRSAMRSAGDERT